MAGDWIKMRTNLPTHPKVVRIASALDADRLRVCGGLFAVWCLFDTHSVDGKLDGYTVEVLDNMLGFPGFGAAMCRVGWLEVDGESLSTPRFDSHNGTSAKRRAQETDRKREDRKLSASNADEKRSREEKRREEEMPCLSPAMLPTDEGEAMRHNQLGVEPDGVPDCPHEALIALYAHHFPTHAQPRLSLWRDGKNGKALRARWRWVLTERQESGDQAGERMATTRQEGLEWFGKFFAYAADSDWLSGRSKREGTWACDLGWLVTAGNFEKVMSGQYENKEATHA